jgi:transposase-like protein
LKAGENIMKPIQEAIEKAEVRKRKKEQLEHDQKQFEMCIDERVCPRCADLLYIKAGGPLKERDYRCYNPECNFTHQRKPNIIAAEG